MSDPLKIGLIACSHSKKQISSAPAEEIYSASTLFRYSVEYCKKNFDDYYILSAKYGFLKKDDIISPYNQSVKSYSKKERKVWSNQIFIDLQKHILPGSYIYIY